MERRRGYLVGDNDPAEMFKGLGEPGQALVAGLLDSAGSIGQLETDLSKARELEAQPDDPKAALEKALKTTTDPAVRALLKAQAAELAVNSKRVETLEKAAQAREVAAFVKDGELLTLI